MNVQYGMLLINDKENQRTEALKRVFLGKMGFA